MSGTYYSASLNKHDNFLEQGDHARDDRQTENSQESFSQPKDNRLYEIEEQLDLAETRCNTLKNQIDFMKKKYNNKPEHSATTINKESKAKISDSVPKVKSSTHSSKEMSPPQASSKPYVRQNSASIGTDHTGAAVKTINNILNGITDSVNRISVLQHHKPDGSKRHQLINKTSPFVATPQESFTVQINARVNQNTQTSSNTTTTLEGTNVSLTRPLKPVRRKRVVSSRLAIRHNENGSAASLLRPNTKTTMKHSDKKFKVNVGNPKVISEETASAVASEKPHKVAAAKKVKLPQKKEVETAASPMHVPVAPKKVSSFHKLVEIYHNKEAKESDSDDDHKKAAKRYVQQKMQEQSLRIHKPRASIIIPRTSMPDPPPPPSVPPLTIPVHQVSSTSIPNIDTGSIADPYEEPTAPRSGYSSFSKNYALPTIASKMKQVVRLGFNMFDFKGLAIPFCPVMSTTPSHNIGINIQQVMSIIKTRQPVKGISPTLAHNIGLAAERLQSKPLSALVSSMTTRLGFKSMCPLNDSYANYTQLQEMARYMPEQCMDQSDENLDGQGPALMTGASGDMQMAMEKSGWNVDIPNSRCTCVPRGGSQDFQQVYNKYRSNHSVVGSTYHQQLSPSKANTQQRMISHMKRIKGDASTVVTSCGDELPPKQQGTYDISQDQNLRTTNEKNLKIVLMNLHDEFEKMNEKYDSLKAQSKKQQPPEASLLKDLEILERDLNKKEEEITMVMSLYKEVLALKLQVKTLRKKASYGTIGAKDAVGGEYNPKAAHHLTKLLQQIQTYQTFYKKSSVQGII